MKTGMILPMSLNMCNESLLSISIRITHRASFILAALVYVLMTGVLLADTHYVDAARPDDSGDGLSWATASKTIQAAITASTAGDTITVTNGVYAPITTTNNSITIQSVNGAAFTIIDGGRRTRCATLGSSSSHTNTILVGITLRNGYSFSSSGGGASFGTLNNCTLMGNSASSGGGAFYGTLNNCTLSGNSASSGGGSRYGTLNNCTLSGNSASSGGGSYDGTLNNCMFSGNSASSFGGGAYYGTLNNCTLTGNSASSAGGGSRSGTLNNCIVWDNTLASGVINNFQGGTFNYSCTAPLPSGTGNVSADPLFRLPVAGDYRLSPRSPCLNTGTNGYVVGTVDGLGNPRIQDGTVDMGAFEGVWTLATNTQYLAQNISAVGCAEGITVSWYPPSVGGAVLYRVCRMDMATEQWTFITGWISEKSFLDTQVYVGVIYRYAVYSAFDVRFDLISGLSATAEGQRAMIPHFYVDSTRPNDEGDGRSWITAKKTIQAAIDISVPYDFIFVTNGVYAPISTANRMIAIRSVNGSGVTIIDGGVTNRCATLGSASIHLNTILVGFTLRNGSASYGGGSYCGTLYDCTLMWNSASEGGGSYYGTLNNCTLTGNSASSYGGGSRFGTLNNCKLIGNRASSAGGGAYDGSLNACTLTGNNASYGGGSAWGTLNNCMLTGNSASTSGGGSYCSTLNNCTLTGNIASSSGGGSSSDTLNNCIVWGNSLTSGETNNYNYGVFSYSCTMPLASGTGNVSADPLFRQPVAGDYRLSPSSPCLNAGTNDYAVGLADAQGNPRILDGTVDMGAYEGAGTLLEDGSFLACNVSAIGGAEGVTVSWQPPSVGGAVLYRVFRIDGATGNWISLSGWISETIYLDEQLIGGLTFRYAIVSAFDVRLDAISGLSASVEAQRDVIPQLYVDAARPNDLGDGRSWATAKKSIQAAIGASVPYDTILVTNGVYAPISTGNKEIAIRSVNGADVTIIDGGGTDRCATLGISSFDVNTVLIGLTLRNGSASSGAGACYGTLNACTLTGNIALSSGGGSYCSTLNNCTLTGNIAPSGGGSFDGKLNNCTLTGNIASSSGGGSSLGILNNCIVWGNTSSSGSFDNYEGGTFSYSCSEPLASGTGNLSADPLFRLPVAGDFRLSPGSPCLNAGVNWYVVGAMDGFGNPRIQDGTVEMGAYEGAGTLLTDASCFVTNVAATGDVDGIDVSWDTPSIVEAVLYRVCRRDMATGLWTPVSGWLAESRFLDTQLRGGVTSRYAIVTAFDTRLDVISGLSAPAEGQRTWSPQFYVDASRSDDVGDGRTWTTAKKTIQAAIGAAAPYDTILVSNGVYASISTANKAIEIRSVNGADVTIIDGGGINRCATLGSTSIHLNTSLVGFTLRNGNASDGGGSCYGTLDNCTLSANSAYYGGGSYYGTLNNCTLEGNNALYGGGSCYGALNNCTLTGNSASYSAGGAYFGTLNNCTLMRNSASYSGGGSYYCTLNNCKLTGNSASYGLSQGGGSYCCTLNNCTLTGNSASDGGGSYEDTLNNCIVWGNTSSSDPSRNYKGGTFSYSCTTPLPSGTGNMSLDPLFRLPAVGDYRLSPGSPCLDKGTNVYAFGPVDLLGNARVQNETVDIGAYEGVWRLETDATHLALNVSAAGRADGITVSWDPPSAEGALLYQVFRLDIETGQWMSISDWISERSILDTQVFAGVLYRYAVYSAFDAPLNVISGLSATTEGQRCLPPFYVDASRPNDAGDGRTWKTAKKTIQSAIGAAVPYDTILVTNGVYAPISTGNKAIMIRSVNGAAVTIIDGGGTNRCATMSSSFGDASTVLEGFSLRNGFAYEGGGSCYGTLNYCMLTGNNASYNGGGAYFGTLNNCTLTGNSAYNSGGGAYRAMLNKCTLTGNSSFAGGGACNCTLNNCLLTGNNASYGGGVFDGTQNNCTLTGNTASYGGGASYSTLNNCIVWGNSPDNYIGNTLNYCCTIPLPDGNGNISDDPLFVDLTNSNFALRVGSPCINAGSNAFVVGTTDLAGNPRIQNNIVDMGAYEMLSLAVTLDWQNGLDVTLTNVLYGQAYQLPSAVFADARFMGWWTLPNGMGSAILPETLVSATSNHTLYAKWDVNSVVGSTGLVWQTEGDSLWFVQTNVVTQGLSAMQSGVISNDQTSWIGTSVTGRGCFSFWWRVSSEGGYDELAFAVDGVENRAISGTKKAEWQLVEVAFTTAGAHELRWTYSKDDSVSEGLDCGWLDRVAWIPARPIIPGNPNVSSNFLDNVTQSQVDALVAGLRAAHPDVTDGEIAKKFEDADLFGFTGAALVGVGADALVRFNPSITLATLSVVEGDPRTLVVKMTIGNNIDPTPAAALAQLGEAINSRLRGVFKNSLTAGASESILAPALSLDNATGVVTATFTLESPFTTTGFLRMNLSR